MPLIINTNISSINSQRALTTNTNALAKSLERLSSGYRINRAADDAAGLQLSENLRTQIRGSRKALDNVQDGIGFLNIMDGSLGSITNNLQRMRELAVQSANDTYDATQRQAMMDEFTQLSNDIDRVFRATEFNGVVLFDGSADTDGDNQFMLQVGPNAVAANDAIDLVAEGLGFLTGGAASALTNQNVDGNNTDLTALDISSDNATSQLAITDLDTAITGISAIRGTIGAVVNRLENAAQNLMIGIENLSASESRVRNVDVAAESAELTRNQILQQASAAMLAQANQAPGLALQLLQN